MQKEMENQLECSALETRMQEASLSWTKPILLSSRIPGRKDIWLRWKGGKDKDFDEFEGSYNKKLWWDLVGLWWLVQFEYDIIDSNIESMYDIDGNPLRQSTKAAEAKPPYIPPLFEEREI